MACDSLTPPRHQLVATQAVSTVAHRTPSADVLSFARFFLRLASACCRRVHVVSFQVGHLFACDFSVARAVSAANTSTNVGTSENHAKLIAILNLTFTTMSGRSYCTETFESEICGAYNTAPMIQHPEFKFTVWVQYVDTALISGQIWLVPCTVALDQI